MKTLTDQEFDSYLDKACQASGLAAIMAIAGVREIVSEHFNNAVIEAWERDNPLPDIDAQISPLIPEWERLVAALIPEIADDYRATDDPDDNEPGMCLTVGFTPETRERDASWGYQTGDNSFTGGAYSHPHWAVVYLSRDSKPAEVAQDIADEIAEMAAQ